jgi:hypothetical protein
MSYTISISGLEIECNYSSNYKLLNDDDLKYFIQIITDQYTTYNFSGTGVPQLDTDDIEITKSLFILTVFSDNTNSILMPTIYLQDIAPYIGLTLNAFVNNNTNRIQVSSIGKSNDNIFIYNVDSSNNIVSEIGNMGSLVFLLFQPIGNNLYIDLTNSSQYYNSSINSKISTLIINTQLYNGIINKTMPNYFSNILNNTDKKNPSKTNTPEKNNNIFIILIIIIIIIIFAIGLYYLFKKYKINKSTY